MATATRSKRRTRTAAAANPQRRRAVHRPPQPQGPDTATIVTWASFALVGLMIAAGVAAILVDDVPFEDRAMRNARLRLRDRASSASADAITSLGRQFAELRGEIQQRLADLR